MPLSAAKKRYLLTVCTLGMEESEIRSKDIARCLGGKTSQCS